MAHFALNNAATKAVGTVEGSKTKRFCLSSVSLSSHDHRFGSDCFHLYTHQKFPFQCCEKKLSLKGKVMLSRRAKAHGSAQTSLARGISLERTLPCNVSACLASMVTFAMHCDEHSALGKQFADGWVLCLAAHVYLGYLFVVRSSPQDGN